MAAPDVLTAARFQLTVTGLPGGDKLEFSELAGISMEIDIVEFQDNMAGQVRLHKLPGKCKPATITLKRPMNSTKALWDWHEALNNPEHRVVGTTIDELQRHGILNMFSMDGGEPLCVYEFDKGWPSKMSISGMKAGASEVMIEEVVITCGMLTRIK